MGENEEVQPQQPGGQPLQQPEVPQQPGAPVPPGVPQQPVPPSQPSTPPQPAEPPTFTTQAPPPYGQPPQYAQSPQHGQSGQLPQTPQYSHPSQPAHYGQPPQQYGVPPFQPATTGRGKGSIWFGLIATVLGVAGLVCSMIPGEYDFRILISAVGIGLSLVGVVIAIIGLRKRWRNGFSIAGIIVSGIALLFGAAFLSMGLIANAQIEASSQRSNEELKARLAEEQAAKDAILDQSQWIDDARAEVKDAVFTEVDATTLAEIIADPESHMETGVIVEATMPGALSHPGFNDQGICLTEVTIAAIGEDADPSNRVAILDRGTADECPLTNQLLGVNSDDSVSESFSEKNRMQLIPAGMIPGPNGKDIPSFLLFHME